MKEGGGRPITSDGLSQPLGQDRPPPASLIHIGFLSRGKTLSLNRIFFAFDSRRFFGLRLWPAVLPRAPNVPKRPRSFDLLRTWEFLFHRFVESAGPRPTALSHSHPSGSRPDTSKRSPRTRPHPDLVGPRTTSVPHPVQLVVPHGGGTGHILGLTRSDRIVNPV